MMEAEQASKILCFLIQITKQITSRTWFRNFFFYSKV